MRNFRFGAERIDRRDDNTECEERKVKNRDVERGRGNNESDVASAERIVSVEGEGKGVKLADEVSVGDSLTGETVDKKSSGRSGGGGGLKKRKSELSNGEALRRRRKRNGWP